MDEMYAIHSVLAPSSNYYNYPTYNNNVFCNNMVIIDDDGVVINGGDESQQSQQPHHRYSDESNSERDQEEDMMRMMMMSSDVVKAQIASHPLYPNLLSAYIQCTKIAAPPEMATILDEISKLSNPTTTTITEFGVDPELDEFMESYCSVLYKYKEELSKAIDEANTFLSGIELQLSNLCKHTLPTTTSSYHSCDEVRGMSEEEPSCGESEVTMNMIERQVKVNDEGEQRQIKEMLMQRYRGYLSSLRKEFLKKRTKAKLPNDARTALLCWWNSHFRWPYPTEEEKKELSEVTGLDERQINNWFINQRKRHWRPSEDMRLSLIEDVVNNNVIDDDVAGSMCFDVGNNGVGTI